MNLTKAEQHIKENSPDIFNQYYLHKGEIVLDVFDVVRLIELEMDDDDYYYVFNDRKKIFWSSCVGSFIPLRNKITDVEYKRLESWFNMNDFSYTYNVQNISKELDIIEKYHPDRFKEIFKIVKEELEKKYDNEEKNQSGET